MILLLGGAVSAVEEAKIEHWNPAGRLDIRESFLGCPELLIELPKFKAGEKAESLYLLRSTTDLSKYRTNNRFPIARLPINSSMQAYMDTLAPQGVPLYYQLETRTDQGAVLWSNVKTIKLPPPTVSEIAKPGLVVDKRAYSLLLLDGKHVVRRFPIALGANCVDRKLHQDKASTPEGVYSIVGLQPQATYHKAFDINYPNETDHSRYKFFASQGLLPYPTPRIGGEIQIHGDGIESNWTWGCVALRNSDMDWLFARSELQSGIEVRIVGHELRPEDLSLVENLSPAELSEVRTILIESGYLIANTPTGWTYAISQFQKEKGLTITGILDQVTRARILKSKNGDFG